jgi:predicted nucleic acid binding AN1-type Zn finger protein
MPSMKCSVESCKRKLALTDFPCKCEKTYCSTHRLPETHACSYDYKESGKKELLKFMSTPVIAKKIEVL